MRRHWGRCWKGATGAIALVTGGSCLSHTSHIPVTDSVYAAANNRWFSSGPVSTLLGGVKLGYEARQVGSELAGFVEAGYLQAGTSWFKVISIGGGAKYAAFTQGRFELGVVGLLEYQNARYDEFQNSNHLIAVGVGGYGEFRVASSVALTLTLSAHGFLDATSPTTCNDGSTSNSTGQGTCSYHDGIAHYNDELGPGAGLDGLIGVSVWFDAVMRE